MEIPIVDENDNIIGYKDRSDININDIIRITTVWVTDESGENILLQQRKLTKNHSPGKWVPGASGTVEKGESYEFSASRELEEETGIKGFNLIKIKKHFGERIVGGYRFSQMFLCKIPRDYKLIPQESEVEQLKWFTKKELKNEIENNPNDFLPIVHLKMKE
jgi:isopentenyl-diphosphate delta-isomerase